MSEWRGVAAAMRAGNVVASGMGSMPLKCDDPEIELLLNDQANELQTGAEFVEQLTLHAVFTGAGRAFVDMKRGKPAALYPILPNWTTGEWKWVEDKDGEGEYVLPVHIDRGDMRNEYIGDYPRDRILEITSPRWEMTRSLSTTQNCSKVLGLACSLQERQARLADTNAPYGILTAKEGTGQEAINKLKTSWSSQFGKTGIAVVDFEAAFTQLMQNASDQQLLETMQFQIEEIARMYGVHPYMLFKLSGSGSQGAIADIMLFHQVYTMGPWIRRWESALKRTVTGGKPVNFDETALLRTTPTQRAEINARALGGGLNGVEVGQGAVDQARITFGAFNRRHERVGTGRHHQRVVIEAAFQRGHHDLVVAVDGGHRLAEVRIDAPGGVRLAIAHGQVLRLTAAEHVRQVHPVVGGARFLAQHGDVRVRPGRHQLLDKVMTDHAVADDHDLLLFHTALLLVGVLAHAVAALPSASATSRPNMSPCRSAAISCCVLMRSAYQVLPPRSPTIDLRQHSGRKSKRAKSK